MPTSTKAKPESGEKNTYKLPRGEKLRRELVAIFSEQRRRILGFLATGRKDGRALDTRSALSGAGDRAAGRGGARVLSTKALPFHWPNWHDFGMGALDLAERMTPLLSLTWDAAGSKFASRIGLDPDKWSVTNPHTARMIQDAALAFSDSMNQTTSLALDRALEKTREELHEGVVVEGESVEKLTKRINAIFDGAQKWRARRIAQTETSRAVHAAQEQAAIQSKVVTGWEWMLSGDACPTCIAIAARARFVRLGHAFAIIGDSPHYSQIKFPPAHPHCNCTVVEVLDIDEQPAWSDTLHQPKPATDEEHAAVAAITQERDNRTLGGKPAAPKPVKPPRPRPAARKPAPAVKPSKPPKPAPAKPVKPATPTWKPGQPIDPQLPIGDRIKAADHLEDKLEGILALDKAGAAQAAIDAILAEWRALEDEIRAYTSGPGANLSQLDPAHVARLREFDRREREILARAEAVRDAEKARIRTELAGILDLGKGDRVDWRNKDGAGSWRTSNGATRKEATDWLAAKLARGPQAGPIEVTWNAKPNARAFARRGDSSITVKVRESAGTMVHEMGHHVEYRAPGAEKAAQDFLAHRVGNQPLRKLRDVVPGSTYRANEEGRDDDFAKAFGARDAWYVGKHYPHGSTEIISMGIELLYNSPVHFAKSDPEYCKFILGILDGSMRTP